jgi:hypothetical protein
MFFFDEKSEGTITGARDQTIRPAEMLSLKKKDIDAVSQPPGDSLRMS